MLIIQEHIVILEGIFVSGRLGRAPIMMVLGTLAQATRMAYEEHQIQIADLVRTIIQQVSRFLGPLPTLPLTSPEHGLATTTLLSASSLGTNVHIQSLRTPRILGFDGA